MCFFPNVIAKVGGVWDLTVAVCVEDRATLAIVSWKTYDSHDFHLVEVIALKMGLFFSKKLSSMKIEAEKDCLPVI